MVQGGNFIVRKSALDKIGGFNTGIKFYGEDTDIARRMHSLGDVKFTFALPIWSSGRRLRKDGVIRTAWRYTINYISVIFRGTAKEYEAKDIR
jgi:GT2 family glycosyltransferase